MGDRASPRDGDNCQVKLMYRAQTPEEARYMSELSGSIVARERKFRASANPAVVELQTSENTQVEREYPLIPSAKLSPGGAENRSCVWNATPRHIGGNSVLAQRERSSEIDLHHVQVAECAG